MGFSLGSSHSVFLLLGEEALLEVQLFSLATAIGIKTGYSGWTLPSSAPGTGEGNGSRKRGGLTVGVRPFSLIRRPSLKPHTPSHHGNKSVIRLPVEDTRPVGGEAGTGKEKMRGMEEEQHGAER